MKPSVAVPPEQLPINEYQELRESVFFHWATVEPLRYSFGLTAVWVLAWGISGPVAAWSYPPLRMPIEFFLAGAAGAWVPLLLIVARLYLGWSYIYDRLSRSKIIYEETGGHDGHFWVKPPEVLAKDRLLVEYQILPVLQRLRQTLTVVGGLAAVNGLAWWIL